MNQIEFQKGYSTLVNPGYLTPTESQKAVGSAESGDFAKILESHVQKQNSNLIFSKHALQRIDSRGIQISPQLLTQMDSAVEEAKGKGIKDALMISGQAAFIVNIPSRTVVTTLNGQEMHRNVFTNIDGAVIL